MNKTERERLAFELVPGEMRGWVDRASHPSADICFSVLRRQGAADAPLLFIHGAASNASRYEAFFETSVLSERHPLIRLDLRGHGASEGSRPATLERHAADIAAVLDCAGFRRAVLVGHSLGAHVAMYAAAAYPERVLGLALIDPLAPEALVIEAERCRRRQTILVVAEALGRLVDALGFQRRLPRYSLRREDEAAQECLRQGGKALERFVKRYSSPWEDLKHMHLADYARDFLEVGRATPDAMLEQLRIPMCVMASKRGAYTDADRLRAWANKFRAAFALLDCVHWPLTECPQAVAAVLADWTQAMGKSESLPTKTARSKNPGGLAS